MRIARIAEVMESRQPVVPIMGCKNGGFVITDIGDGTQSVREVTRCPGRESVAEFDYNARSKKGRCFFGSDCSDWEVD